MSPTHQMRQGPLFKEMSSRRALKAAWFQVRPRVINSRDAKVRAAADEFGRDLDRSIARLQQLLRSGKFEFAAQRGVLKRTKSKLGGAKKAPRPIVVAPLLNRVAQRAILDTCQSSQNTIKRRLGGLPTILGTETSVGGCQVGAFPKRLC